MTSYRVGQMLPFQLEAPDHFYSNNPVVITRAEYPKQAYRVVGVSQNLRGIIARAHKVGVSRVSVSRMEGGAFVYVSFADASECRTTFADYSIARWFFKSRANKWGLDNVTDSENNLWIS